MNAVNITAKWLEALVKRGRLLRWLMLGLMAAVIVIDILKPAKYSRFPWDGIPAFTALYAFAGALVLIGLYKAIGYGLVYRRADYYGAADDDNDNASGGSQDAG